MIPDDAVEVSVFLDMRHRLGEGPVMDGARGHLYWCDITGCCVYRCDWHTRRHTAWRFEETVGSLGLADDGRLVIALRKQVILFDPASGARQTLCRIEPDDPRTRLNDGKVGPDGAFWVGTMDDTRPRRPIGALYRIGPGGQVRRVRGDIYVSNGLAWSPAGDILYHADSGTGEVDSWDFDADTGNAENRRVFVKLAPEQGKPDGAAVDRDGNYWSAGVSAAVLNCISPGGRLMRQIPVPAARPTMPCFAGPDYAQIVLTSLREGCGEALLEKYPCSGSLFICDTGATGLAPHLFRTS